ncbi:MAG: dienelactone hydrolase family protein [Dehalococcoidia bacterium]|nr:dienelactone hydrolase family protein [Dehalococcoidia bacterium]
MERIADAVEREADVRVIARNVALAGNLFVPREAKGIVVFAHGSGSGRNSPRNRFVARALQERGLGTLLFDLLTVAEEAVDSHTTEFRFDISLLADRLTGATDWLTELTAARSLKTGYFGASTGAAAALIAASRRPESISAIVSRGGRPDMAGDALARVRAPVLLIVGSRDNPTISINQRALDKLNVEKELVLIPGATHLFEEPGALEEVARLAGRWFVDHF